LNQKADGQSGQSQTEGSAAVIQACFVLHNILVKLNDEMNRDLEARPDDENEVDPEQAVAEPIQSGKIVRDQVKNYLFINRDFLQQ
jgi:hypothetical protein